jgi:hypothetical protein
LDTHTGNLVEFLETDSLVYISDVCCRHNRAWAGTFIDLQSSCEDARSVAQRTTQMPADRPTRLASAWSVKQDEAEFAMAVRRLRQLEDVGETLPLHFTLPTGRSIESLCDRVAHLKGELSGNILQVLHNLAVAVSVPVPTINSYESCAPVLRAVAERLAMPRDRR